MNKVKVSGIGFAAMLAGMLGGRAMAPRPVTPDPAAVEVPVYIQRHVIIESQTGVYELSNKDSADMRKWLWGMVDMDVTRLDAISCTFAEGVTCQLTGEGQSQIIPMTGERLDVLKSHTGGMFRGKLEDIARIDCTLRMEHDVCTALGSKLIPVENLKKGDMVLRIAGGQSGQGE